MADGNGMSSTEKYYRRWKSLEAERNSFMAHWRELSEYILPVSGRYLNSSSDKPNEGGKLNDKIIDGTATRAINVLAAGLQGGLTSPARPWFRLGTPDPDLMEVKQVRVWLETVRDIMLHIMARSNFYSVIHGLYQELAVFGTGCMHIEEDYNHVIRCRLYTVGEYCLALDQFYRVNSLYRVFHATAGQLVARFGRDAVSDQVRRLVENRQLDEWVKCVHAIEPRAMFDTDKLGAKEMPWASVYFEWGKSRDQLLSESGYEEFPVLAPRWNVAGSDVYGRGPGMDALGDIKMLQELQAKSLIAIDQQVNPTLNAPATMKGVEPISLRPGDVNYINGAMGGQGLAPTFQSTFNIQQVEGKIQQVQRAIREAFFNDLFLMLAGETKQMTATEVAERHEEKLLMVGPMLERFESECLDPCIDRVFSIAERHQLFPPPPQELVNKSLKVEYISLLAQAQKAVSTSSIERVARFAGSLVQVAPEVRHKINFAEAVDQYAENVGAPPRMINSDDEAAKASQAEQQMQMMQQAVNMAQQAASAGRDMSQSQVGKSDADESLLDRLLAQAGVK